MSRIVKASSALPAHVVKDGVVRRLLEAERALMHAMRIDQVKVVLDVAAAQEVFARRQKLGEDVIAHAQTVKVRALSRLGELLKTLEKQKPGVKGRTKRLDGTRKAPSNAPPTLADLGVSKKVASQAQRLAALPVDTREQIATGKKKLGAALREKKAAEVRKALELPTSKYRVLYADPPWSYRDKADEGAVQSGGAERHYPSLSIAELCAVPVPSICEDDAVLFLWVTSPLLFESAAVFKAWGFAYKASFVWDKIKHNLGHYNSVRHEFLLVCTRGSCTPDNLTLFDSVQSIERTTHSTKPEDFRRIIESLYPYGRRLELFARREAPGWDTYGYDAPQAAAR